MADGPKQPRSRVLLDVHVPRAWLAGVLAALVVLLIGAVIGFSAVNRVDTCDICHLVRPEVASYKKSAHYRAGVTCQQCHTSPGAFNYIIRNLEGVTNLILYVSDKYERPLTTYVGADNCVQCHTNQQIEKDLIVGNIRINHIGLRKAGYQCVLCHADVTHPGSKFAIAQKPQSIMAICARCHNGVTLPNNCDLCHINGVPANAPKIKIPVELTSQECTQCHTQKEFCSECHHGLTMPHPAGWTKEHGAVVEARGTQICASCHTDKNPKFCIDCHGLQMPHPAGWQTAHAAVGQKDPQLCVKCHGQNSCIKCHGLQMPHPADWLAQHGSVALKNSALCSKCHPSTAFCTACHGVSLPHSSSFIANHPQYAASEGGVCVKCHHNNGAGADSCYGGDCHTGPIQ